ncbi:MAG: class II aldolase/adducin family protein [Sedimentisphaerales bacterium]|nr:class II aldolase/adducin family protein [Sedimentisphaerales bacterium]
MQVDQEKMKAFVEACHKVGRYGLVQCSSGNLSWRIGDGLALLSASRSWLPELTEQQVSICRIETNEWFNDVKPTCETVFHLGILKQRLDQNIVLHFQSPYATAIACGEPTDYDFNVIIEVPVYIGIPAIVEYLPPGSPELAQATIDAMREHDMIILRNHGLVTVGRDFNDAIQKATFFELACQILLLQRQYALIPPEAIAWLRNAGQA